MKTTLLFLLFTLLTISTNADCTNILIAKNLTAYEVLDKFEQPLTKRDVERRFPLSSPLTVAKANDMLGDDITMALSFSYGDDDYYLLKTDSNTFSGNSAKQKHKIYKCCKIICDTAFYNGMAIREFKYRGRYYINRDGKYSWSTTKKSDWKKKKVRKNRVDHAINSSLLTALKEKIYSANNIYKRYFQIFNKLENKTIKAPKWIIKKNSELFSCKLSCSELILENLKKSTGLLCDDMETLLIGTDFVLEYSNLEIVIK